jgi:DnaJ-class molecular chaperone
MYVLTDSQALEILGLKDGRDKAAVKRAYHALAKKYHPDNELTGKKEAYELIRAAYEHLMNKSDEPMFPRRIIGKPGGYSDINRNKKERERFEKQYKVQMDEKREELVKKEQERKKEREAKKQEMEHARRAAEIIRRLILMDDK